MESEALDLSMKKKVESDDEEQQQVQLQQQQQPQQLQLQQQPQQRITASSSKFWSKQQSKITTAPCYTKMTQRGPYFRRNVRGEASLMPPIRQTASIFKQPVTIIKNQDSYVKHDLKYGPQEKPRQLFWEKRLENLKACDINGEELGIGELPAGLFPVGPNVSQETLLQSLATALHLFSHPVVGQTATASALEENSGAFLNPEQPLAQPIGSIQDEDIQKQEEKVQEVRRKLEDAINEAN